MSGVFLCLRIIFCRSASGKCGDVNIQVYVVLKRGIGCTSRGECCSPSFPSGKVPSFDMGVLITPPLPAGDVVLKCGIEFTSRGECCSPSFPSGIPPPLGKSAVLLKCGIHFSSFLIKFESRIEIIERRDLQERAQTPAVQVWVSGA